MGLDSECDVMIDARLRRQPGRGRRRSPDCAADLIAEHLGADPAEVAAACRRAARSSPPSSACAARAEPSFPFRPPEFSAALTAVAKSELLDPEGSDQPFEPLAGNRLVRRLRR
jgi:hypothetical protein